MGSSSVGAIVQPVSVLKSMLLLIFSLLTSARAWDQGPNLPIAECSDDLPFGVPTASRASATLRCTGGYALLHDNDARIAAWAGWTITPDEALGCVPREDGFVEDLSLPAGRRASPDDYTRSGFDRGHIVPNADLSWSRQTMLESFLMSNMSPQYPNLNRGAWKYLETNERTWAWARRHSITVYAGNIYRTGARTIGKSGVVVPDSLYKILIDNATGEVMAFIFPNSAKQEIDLRARLVSVAQVESAAGVSFPVPAGHDKASVARDVWPADQGDMGAAKKTTCTVRVGK